MDMLNEPNDQVRLALLDFEPIRAAGVRELFAFRPDIEVVVVDLGLALTGSGYDLMLILPRKQSDPHALVNRLRVRHPEMKVVLMGQRCDDEMLIGLITAGARGWIEETASPDQMRQAVQSVLSGSIWAPRRILSEVVNRALNGAVARSRQPVFTSREEEVLQQLVLARSNREIAEALSIREQTVKSYVGRLMRKVGVDNRIALSMQVAAHDWWRSRV